MVLGLRDGVFSDGESNILTEDSNISLIACGVILFGILLQHGSRLILLFRNCFRMWLSFWKCP